MPQKEIINFSKVKSYGVNTNFIVGPGGANGPADVMLVQALFRYIANLSMQSIKMQSGLAGIDLSAVDGVCGAKTNLAILQFQRANAQKLIKVDGRIHPASYEGRVMTSDMTDYIYQSKAKPIMTITLLHLYAFYAEPTRDDYISGLVAIAPELKTWLN